MFNIHEYETYNLFLDDFRTPKDCLIYMPEIQYYTPDIEYFIAKDYISFIEILVNEYTKNNKIPKFISFDHDLKPNHYAIQSYDGLDQTNFTGLQALTFYLNFLSSYELPVPKYLGMHTMNKWGLINMVKCYNSSPFYKNPMTKIGINNTILN